MAAKPKKIETRLKAVSSKLFTATSRLENNAWALAHPEYWTKKDTADKHHKSLLKYREKVKVLTDELDALIAEYQQEKGACPQCGEQHL